MRSPFMEIRTQGRQRDLSANLTSFSIALMSEVLTPTEKEA